MDVSVTTADDHDRSSWRKGREVPEDVDHEVDRPVAVVDLDAAGTVRVRDREVRDDPLATQLTWRDGVGRGGRSGRPTGSRKRRLRPP